MNNEENLQTDIESHREEICKLIREALPSIGDETLQDIISQLFVTMGVCQIDDLKLLREKDFENKLSTIQCRRFINFLSSFFANKKQLETQPTSSNQSITAPVEPTRPSFLQPTIDWNSIPLIGKDKLSLSEEKCIIDSITKQVITQYNLMKCPHEDTWKFVINELVKKNTCFDKHKIKGNKSSPHASLVITIMNRAKYHCNQLSGRSNEERAASTNLQLLPPAKRQRAAAGDAHDEPNYSYNVPDGETEESLLAMEKELQDMSKGAETAYDDEKITKFMELLHSKIYSVVRMSKTTFDDLVATYPFLLKLTWCRQYVMLSEKIDAEDCFKKFVDSRLDAAIRFLTRKSSSVDICIKIEEEMMRLQKTTSSRVPRIVGGLLMIASHLEKSKFKGIFKIMDVSSPDDVINSERDMPMVTPKLVALGASPMVAEVFCLVANGRVVGRTTSIVHAFASYFCSFYAMHVQYPSELATFLEFVQRYIMGIEDEGSAKLTSRGKTMKPGRKQAFSQTAVKLHQKIEEFAVE